MDDVPEVTDLFSFRRTYRPPSNPCQPYYVQSPSPCRAYDSPAQNSITEQPSRFSLSILSRYSSSRSSTTNSEKPTVIHFKSRNSAAVADADDEEENEGRGIIRVRDILVKNEYEDDEGEFCYYERTKKRVCFGFLRIGRNSSNAWICLQIGLRFVISLGLALLVFYMATKPPPPTLSIQMVGISGFELREGVDRTGIPTKILSCNSSIHLLADNKSKVFPLQLHPPLIGLYFDHLLLAASHSSNEEMNVETYQTALIKMTVGTRHKPMYGAGRSMQDMLDSGKGVRLVFKMTVKSSFHVLGCLINPEFHHKATCEVFLSSHYNKNNHTQSFNSTCKVTELSEHIIYKLQRRDEEDALEDAVTKSLRARTTQSKDPCAFMVTCGVDFYVLHMENTRSKAFSSLILERPFLFSTTAKIDVHEGLMTMTFGGKSEDFFVFENVHHPCMGKSHDIVFSSQFHTLHTDPLFLFQESKNEVATKIPLFKAKKTFMADPLDDWSMHMKEQFYGGNGKKVVDVRKFDLSQLGILTCDPHRGTVDPTMLNKGCSWEAPYLLVLSLYIFMSLLVFS